MGKKSKKKGGGAASRQSRKSAHRERLLERRERQQDAASREIVAVETRQYQRPYFVGDRVFFYLDGGIADRTKDHHSYRGIVQKVRREKLDIISLRSKIDGRNEIVQVPVGSVFPDFMNFTLRFDVGEHVICHGSEGDELASVSYLWAIDEVGDALPQKASDVVLRYKCKRDQTLRGLPYVAAPFDDDSVIMKLPDKSRLSEGKRVIFNPQKAVSASSEKAKCDLLRNTSWIEASIVKVSLIDKEYGYVSYECEFDVPKGKSRCFVFEDNDEHICPVAANPRDRLAEAISQNCSICHLDYLTQSFHMDVATFRDFLLQRAMEFGSYNCMSWLHHNHYVDVLRFKDDSGNNFLHKIASSQYAIRFITEAGRLSCLKERSDTMIDISSDRSNLTNQVNNDNETWLHILVKRNDIKSLDVALSPLGGLAWELSNEWALDEDRLLSLEKCIHESNDQLMQCMITSFISFRKLKQEYSSLSSNVFKSEDELLKFRDLKHFYENGFHRAKLLVRFIHDYGDVGPRMDREEKLPGIVLKGCSKVFEFFDEADGDFFWNQQYFVNPREDRNEYIQTELSAPGQDNHIMASLIDALVIGNEGHHGHHYTDEDAKKMYLTHLCLHAQSCVSDIFPSWISRMKEIRSQNDYSDQLNRHIDHKIHLMKDDKSLDGRLKILDYLLKKKTAIEVNVLDTIRYRQCGVLRYLFDKGFVSLNAQASKDKQLLKDMSKVKLQFLDNNRVPAATGGGHSGKNLLSVGFFLCFVSIQWDDLQSLQWICEQISLSEDTCNGMNLVHFCAYLGRIEIMLWLHSNPSWTSLVNKKCTRKPFEGMFATHIAVQRGHIVLADILLGFNDSPAFDTNGRPLEFHAKRSPHPFVQEWGRKRERPQILEKNIKKLLELTGSSDQKMESIQDHIQSTHCIDAQTWMDCGYSTFNDPGPSGRSLASIIGEVCQKCCNELVFWICMKIYFSPSYFAEIFWGRHLRESNLQKYLSLDDLLLQAEASACVDLKNCLSKRWFKSLSCIDPSTRDAFLMASIGRNNELLLKVRKKILRGVILFKIISRCSIEIRSMLKHGGPPDDLEELFCISSQMRNKLADEGFTELDLWYEHEAFADIALDDPINMQSPIFLDHDSVHPLQEMMAYAGKSISDIEQLHLIVVAEGQSALMEFCLTRLYGWTDDMELEVARAAAFLGNTSITDLCLDRMKDSLFFTDVEERSQQVMLGVAESLRHSDLSHLVLEHRPPTDPIKDSSLVIPGIMDAQSHETQRLMANKSLVAAVIFGHIHRNSLDDKKEGFHALMVLVDRLCYTPGELVSGIQLVMVGEYKPVAFVNLVELLESILSKLKLDHILFCKQIQTICETAVDFYASPLYSCFDKGDLDKENYKEAFARILAGNNEVDLRLINWLSSVIEKGIDIQRVLSKSRFADGIVVEMAGRKDFVDNIRKLQNKQLHIWSQFDVAKNGSSLEDIVNAIDQGKLALNCRDKGGLLLTHISAAYGRTDLLEWLAVTKGMAMDAKDGQGRTALDVAKAAKALSAVKWITEWQAKRSIASFAQRHYHRMLIFRKRQRLFMAAETIQKQYRGHSARKTYSGALSRRIEASHHFFAVWGDLVESWHDFSKTFGWSSIREQVSDIVLAGISYDNNYFDDTDEQLSKALEGALIDSSDDEICEATSAPLLTTEGERIMEEKENGKPAWLTFRMSSHVVKFLKRGDQKYKSFFVRRMKQLSNGERSRILQKRLKGSKTTIYESYLEQKSGFRILWTEEGRNIVVWFVAKHKEVSRLIQLIDNSKSRSARQRMPESLVSELQQDGLLPQPSKEEIVLDVFGNVPLKVYDVNFHSINDIQEKNWIPKLHLTEEERQIVEAQGTVLVLGRSGTGKTICICNRMEYDFQKFGHNPTFTQLFVARSIKLCKYVSEAVGMEHDLCSFTTFENLLYAIEHSLPDAMENSTSFVPSRRVDYLRFKREFYDNLAPKEKKVEALILWSVIRSFIKGSIEAFKSHDKILPKESFVDVKKLGKSRCRVKQELREDIYKLFRKYERHLREGFLWDDCDRVLYLLSRIKKLKKDPAAFDQIKKSRIYVDEIQDYNQIECLIFFYLCGPGGLFLAGDPAQGVVEGTEFRFEDIRSVGYFVAGSVHSDLIPQKPKIVNINFRSHSGILRTAGAVLDFMFKYFPSSAKQLNKDFGLFQGSRPGFCQNVDLCQLRELLGQNLKGAVIITNDSSTSNWKRALNGYPLVYGIRESKGLEFRTVIILNFFQELPQSCQKPWRNLLLEREGLDFETKHPLVGTQLKQIYTAITRSIERLFFMETSLSIAGEAAVRWLTNPKSSGQESNSLATRNNVDTIEDMSMTSDEFVRQGLDNAELAESAQLEHAHNLLDRAIYCFDQSRRSELSAKARAHRLSVQFRMELISLQKNSPALLETKSAQLMGSLLKEGLLSEVLNLFKSISPFLSPYTRDELDKSIISKVHVE